MKTKKIYEMSTNRKILMFFSGLSLLSLSFFLINIISSGLILIIVLTILTIIALDWSFTHSDLIDIEEKLRK